MCFHDRRYDSRAACFALPPVSRLSVVLGEFYFWLGFGLCLTILLAPWGCRIAYCGPHCGSESARVLASLLGPSPSGVRHLSRVCPSVGDPVGIAHSFHPSLLLGGVLVRLCGGPCWHTRAISWACPPPFLDVGLAGRSRRIVAPLAQCLCWRFPLFVSVSSCGEASPRELGSVGALGGLRWLHLYRLMPDQVSLRHFAVIRWSSGRCFILFLRDVPQVFMAIILSVSLTYACPWLNIPIWWCSLDTWRDEWLGWLSVPLLALTGLCRLRWLLVTTVCPAASCDRHSVAVALSPLLMVAMTPCNCGALGGLYVLVGSLTSPSPGRMFGPSCCGCLPCRETGLTYRPPPRTSRILSHAWLVVTTASSWGFQR